MYSKFQSETKKLIGETQTIQRESKRKVATLFSKFIAIDLDIQKLVVPLHRNSGNTPANCPDGGIGRRAGLKHQWIHFHPGSTPGLGTTIKKGNLRIPFFVFRKIRSHSSFSFENQAKKTLGYHHSRSDFPPQATLNLTHVLSQGTPFRILNFTDLGVHLPHTIPKREKL